MTLVEAIRLEGYETQIVDRLDSVDGGLGTSFPCMDARVYRLSSPRILPNGRKIYFGIALLADSWDHAYGASHEIAEHRYGFSHTAKMFCEQANLLARWLRYK